VALGLYKDDSAADDEQGDSSDEESLPVVDSMTETSESTLGLPARLAQLLAQRPGGSVGDTARAVTALEDAIKRESNDTLRTRLAAARSMILGLP
jgi:hypothetical protein